MEKINEGDRAVEATEHVAYANIMRKSGDTLKGAPVFLRNSSTVVFAACSNNVKPVPP